MPFCFLYRTIGTFNYVEPGILRTEYLCVGSDDQKRKIKGTKEVVRELGAIWGQDRGSSCASYGCAPFSGSHSGGRAPYGGSRTLAVLAWWSVRYGCLSSGDSSSESLSGLLVRVVSSQWVYVS